MGLDPDLADICRSCSRSKLFAKGYQQTTKVDASQERFKILAFNLLEWLPYSFSSDLKSDLP